MAESLSSLKQQVVDGFTEWTKHVDTLSLLMLINQMVVSIAIVLVNKYIFIHGFNFPTTLTFLHLLSQAITTYALMKRGVFPFKSIPFVSRALPLGALFAFAIVSSNYSLLTNTIGTYQMFKIAMTPTLVVMEGVFFRRLYSLPIYLSLIPVIIGISIATVGDISLSLVGLLWGLGSCIATCLYQIWAQQWQKDLDINSLQLMLFQCPISAVLLLFMIPMFDNIGKLSTSPLITMIFGTADADAEIPIDVPSSSDVTGGTLLVLLFVSCLLAWIMNTVFYFLVKRTSPITVQVMGHAKTILLLVLGSVIFGSALTWGITFGMCCALGGVSVYSYYKVMEK